MTGSVKWNFGFAAAGFALTFLLSLSNNILWTSLIRGLVSGAVFFLLAYAVQSLFAVVLDMNRPAENAPRSKAEAEALVGRSFDMVTPDEDEELVRLLQQDTGQEDGFRPLQPPKLASKPDPEQVAKALRHLTEE